MTQANVFSLNRTLGAAMLAIALTVTLSAVAVVASMRQLQTAIDARTRSLEIIRALDDFRTSMLDQETGLRGYLITGQESSLEPYREGAAAFERAVATLRGRLAADPRQSEMFAPAEDAARRWRENIGVKSADAGADPARKAQAAEIESSGEGKRLFDAFREKLSAIEASEDLNLNAQSEAVNVAARRATVVGLAGALVALAICAAVALAVRRTIVDPLTRLASVIGRIAEQDLAVEVPGVKARNEVGAMARAVEVFKRAQIELDRVSLLRTTADTLPAMVGYVDAQRRVGFLNEEFSRWFDLGDPALARGERLADVFGPGGFPGSDKELPAALGGQEARFECRLLRRGVGWRSLEAVFRPHRAGDGRALGAVTLLTDITERKLMELRLERHARDLRRSNEELEQFAYVASHDLKAPLRGIENLVSWIEEDLEGKLEGDVAANMALLKNRVRRLENLLDDLLAYSRAGRGELTRESVDVGQLVRELAALVSPPEGFRIEAGPGLPTIEATRAPLTQALQNLIGNAIKHHDRPSEGHVLVDARKSGARYEFIVCDDGPGVPPQFRERVFGMFQTLRPRDEIEGSGMGLAIVKKLVERQGGRIWLEDGPGGRGLAVHFTWPAQAPDDADRARGEKEEDDGLHG